MVLDFGLLRSGLFPSSEAMGEGLNPSPSEALRNEQGQWVETVYANSVFAEVKNSAVETVLRSYQMPANTVKNGVIIFAVGNGRGYSAGGGSSLLLYIGVAGAEVMVASQSIGVSNHGLHSMSLLYQDSSQDWDSVVSIEVRGKNAVAAGSDMTRFYDLVVLGF